MQTEVRYRTSTIGGQGPAGNTTSYIIVLGGVIIVLFLVVAGLCLYNRYSLARRAVLKEAIHAQHPGEMSITGPRGFALEGQYEPKDVERSVEFIADSYKRAAGSNSRSRSRNDRNDTVSKMLATADALDYHGDEDESGLPGFDLPNDKQKDADETVEAIYRTSAAMLTKKDPASPGSPEEYDHKLSKELARKQPQREKKPSVIPEIRDDGKTPDLPSQPSKTPDR